MKTISRLAQDTCSLQPEFVCGQQLLRFKDGMGLGESNFAIRLEDISGSERRLRILAQLATP